jgi:SMC interacting uncharacterized protein involved in chromosome segregation
MELQKENQELEQEVARRKEEFRDRLLKEVEANLQRNKQLKAQLSEALEMYSKDSDAYD